MMRSSITSLLLLACVVPSFATGDGDGVHGDGDGENATGPLPADYEVATANTCSGEQAEYAVCPLVGCQITIIDCEFSQWSDWGACDCTGLKLRQRSVARHNNEHGEPCDGNLIETESCSPHCQKDPVNCEFGDWGAWTDEKNDCKDWDDQMTRTRDITTFPENGGDACFGVLTEVTQCADKPPVPVQVNCSLQVWLPWGPCSVTCGEGQQMRERSFKNYATADGAPCNDTLKETQPCTLADRCPADTDCKWSDWQAWSACTCTCGGGQMTRLRNIAVAPTGNGELCPDEIKSEVDACNAQSCEECVDGMWGSWTAWTDCSATCEGGIRERSRSIMQPASACGTPVQGMTTQAEICNSNACHPNDNTPCLFTEWSAWSACSCTCNGVERQSRTIKAYGKGGGAFCEGDLEVVRPCNVGADAPVGCSEEPAVACGMGEWNAWGPCTATCDGGQQERKREIVTQPSGGGAPCEGPLGETGPCATEGCPAPLAIDCQWQDWSEWGACDKCGGQKKRFRHIMTMPQHGGSPCEPGDAEETSECERQCHEPVYCEWGMWAEWSECPQGCATAKKSRKRNLEVTNKAPVITAEMFEDLKLQKLNIESTRVRELAVSFVGGLLCFAVVFVVFRRQAGSDYATVTDTRRDLAPQAHHEMAEMEIE